MKRRITILMFGLFFGATYAQSRKGDIHLSPGSDLHRLYVSFNANETPTQLKELQTTYGIILKPAIVIPEDKFEELKNLAVKKTGKAHSVEKLKNIYEATSEDLSGQQLLDIALKLEKLESVEYCSLMPLTPVKPPYDIFPSTPSYFDQQQYITDYGVDMAYAWDLGLTGQGINIRDVEFGFNKDHEELNDRNVYVGADMIVSPLATLDFTEHGTGVLGVLYADKEGDYGVSGLAYGATELALFTEYEQTTGYNRVNAITKCMTNSTEGDIVVYELQATGALGEYGPAEYQNVVWDLTKAATDAGIVVVAAAGNGAENLDATAYNSYNNRGDSGAIIVGAGSSDEFHNRLYFSTYGARVDLQGWGENVLTSGTGSAYTIADDFNQTYTWFNGTSSATPIVASCAIVLQSHYHDVTGNYMTGQELRELLKTTGTPQGSGENIGPLPNMPSALAAMDAMLGINSVEKESFIAYPNPVSDKLQLAGNFSSGVKAEVYNALGQLVYTAKDFNNQIDFSSFARGIYIVKVSDNGKTVSKKIVKN